jgi:hypothetical protein
MNKNARILLWLGGTVAISLIVAILINPAVLLGTIIGVGMMALKQIDMGE